MIFEFLPGKPVKVTKKTLLYFLFIGLPFSVFNQDKNARDDSVRSFLPDGVSIFNQMKYSNDYQKKVEIFEDWLNLDYRQGIFSAGIRFETFQPNDPNPAISRGKTKQSDIGYKYIKAEIGHANEGGEITVGNYYASFGRGMILKSYEDRNIRVDNNLAGVKLVGRYQSFVLTALTGMAENSNAERKDILHAADLEYKGVKKLGIGVSAASNTPDGDVAARTQLLSLRIQPSIWNCDFYGEYGVKQNSDIKERVFDNSESIVGKAFYGSANMYYASFSIAGEYKYYDNYSFQSYDQTVSYNTPPALRKDYTYGLLNRHPSPLDANNEKGYQIESNYSLDENTSIVLSYGITETLPKSSFYQRANRLNLPVRVQLKETYFQSNHKWDEHIATIAALGYNEELATNTKNIIPILENHFYFDDINTIRLTVEHQLTTNRTTDEHYYDDLVSLEYLRSPQFSVGFVGEVETREPTPGNRVKTTWGFIQLSYRIQEHSDLSLLIGSRQAGNICIGGVCRYEPEFKGLELKMLTRF